MERGRDQADERKRCKRKLNSMSPVLRLCKKLQTEYGVTANSDTFRRTYAGRNMKAAGAFIWTIRAVDQENRPLIVAGFEPVSVLIKNGMNCTFTRYEDEWERTFVIETD